MRPRSLARDDRELNSVKFETLRLLGPIPYHVRGTRTDRPSSLSLPIPGSGGKRQDYIIPKDIIVNVNMPIIHTDEEYWGADAYVWRPSRWIRTKPSAADETTISNPLDQEEIFTAAAGHFLAWSWGPRICLGMKFSQVEIAATLSTLFADMQVHPALPLSLRSKAQDPTSPDLAKRLAKEAMEDRRVEVAVTTNRPEDLWLKWTKISFS